MAPPEHGAKLTGIGDLPIPVEAGPIWTDTEEQSQHVRDVQRALLMCRGQQGETDGDSFASSPLTLADKVP